MVADFSTERLNARISTTILLGLLACGACALVPPRHALRNGNAIARVFVFSEAVGKDSVTSDGSSYYAAEVDSGRLLAECILIVVVCGIVILYLRANDA